MNGKCSDRYDKEKTKHKWEEESEGQIQDNVCHFHPGEYVTDDCNNWKTVMEQTKWLCFNTMVLFWPQNRRLSAACKRQKKEKKKL